MKYTFECNSYQELVDLRNHLNHIIHNRSNLEKSYNMPIQSLNLTVRTENCLRANDIDDLQTLMQFNKNHYLKMHNFGRKSLNELIEKLKSLDLQLKD